MTDLITTADRLVRNTISLNAAVAEGVVTNPGNLTLQGRVGLGNNNPASPLGLSRIVAWGVIWRNGSKLPTADIAVKVGNLDLWLLSGGQWTLHQSVVRPNGQLYPCGFPAIGEDNDDIIPAGPAPMLSASPNLIITQAPVNQAYHFYGTRAEYPELDGIVAQFTAKLVSKSGADLGGSDGCYLAQVGVDFKLPETNATIRDAFTSSLMPVTKNMRRFAATSMTLAQLAATPPDLSQFRQLDQVDQAGIDPDYVPA